jgi:hypothetical protein
MAGVSNIDPYLTIECVQDADNVENDCLLVLKTSLLPLKARYMQFLLHCNKNFDDDLLQDSLELLGCS